MFKTLKNQFAKMLIIFGGFFILLRCVFFFMCWVLCGCGFWLFGIWGFGGFFILLVFSGIFLGSYFSSQKEINEILKKSLITASKENIIPEKEDCVF